MTITYKNRKIEVEVIEEYPFTSFNDDSTSWIKIAKDKKDNEYRVVYKTKDDKVPSEVTLLENNGRAIFI